MRRTRSTATTSQKLQNLLTAALKQTDRFFVEISRFQARGTF